MQEPRKSRASTHSTPRERPGDREDLHVALLRQYMAQPLPRARPAYSSSLGLKSLFTFSFLYYHFSLPSALKLKTLSQLK